MLPYAPHLKASKLNYHLGALIKGNKVLNHGKNEPTKSAVLNGATLKIRDF